MSMRRTVVVLLLAMLPLAPSAALAQSAQTPNGLVVVIENRPQENRLDLRALDNPYISRVALQIHWSDIEAAQGNPDWSKLDQLMAAAQTSKKWVQLLIFPGFFTPPWVLAGVQTQPFPLRYGPGKGTFEKLPMPWDTVYLDRWFALVKRLADRYGKSSAFRLIGAAGPTSVSAEYTLPSKPEDVRIWLGLGYSPRKYLAAWRRTLQVYAANFPNQYISMSMGFGLNIDDRGRLAPHERQRFVLQFSNLDGLPGPGPGPGPRAVPFVIGYNGRVITGLQLRTACERHSGDMGAEGNPPLASKKSIDIGMQPNSAGRHINYLEVYEPDVLAEDLQTDLRDGAAQFK
jgi:hypothetical protein